MKYVVYYLIGGAFGWWLVYCWIPYCVEWEKAIRKWLGRNRND